MGFTRFIGFSLLGPKYYNINGLWDLNRIWEVGPVGPLGYESAHDMMSHIGRRHVPSNCALKLSN